jgi:hypothetical protein
MRNFVCVAALAAFLGGCGYPGEPLPPSLKIPLPVQDLRVVEFGDRLVAAFTAPALSTDGVTLTVLEGAELRVGPGAKDFQLDRWLAGTTAVPISVSQPGAVTTSVPVASWINREVVMAVRVTGPKRHASDWSNLAVIQVVPPVARPANLQAKATAAGVELTWQSPETRFQVFRQGPGDKSPQPLSTAEKPEYTDPSAQYGKTYAYSVQAIRGTAQSEVAAAPPITPADKFSPEAPSGLTGIAGAGSVQLAWERNLESDLKGYFVYRSVDNGPFVKLGETDTPAYSDATVQTGKQYRYAVSAVDQSGNESAQCPPQEVTLQ